MEQFFATLGIWLGALFTFAIFSFLYKDNPFYKTAEQIFVGLSAGYWFVSPIHGLHPYGAYAKIHSRWIFHKEISEGVAYPRLRPTEE